MKMYTQAALQIVRDNATGLCRLHPVGQKTNFGHLAMPLNSIPWTRWKFSLMGVLFGGFSICMAWHTITGSNDLRYLRFLGAVAFLGFGVFLLVLEWRNRLAHVFRMPAQPEEKHQ